MIRLLVEDVTLTRGDGITAHIRFKGGQTTSLTLPLPLTAPDLRRTSAGVVTEIDRLLDDHPDAGVAAALNHAGLRSGTGQRFRRNRPPRTDQEPTAFPRTAAARPGTDQPR